MSHSNGTNVDHTLPAERRTAKALSPHDRNAVSVTESVLTKGERGRLKKLVKRSKPNGSGSGLTSDADWEELQDLWKRSSSYHHSSEMEDMGPSVLVTKKERGESDNMTDHIMQKEQWQRCEASDLRHVLLHLLFHNGNVNNNDCHATTKKAGQKRKLGAAIANVNTDTKCDRWIPPLPSWAHLYNPVTTKSVVVLEFSLETGVSFRNGNNLTNNNDASSGNTGSEETTLTGLPSTRFQSLNEENGVTTTILQKLMSQEGHFGKRAHALNVRFFQGDARPRHMTHVLMYMDPPIITTSLVNNNDGSIKTTEPGAHENMDPSTLLSQKLEPLRMTTRQLRSEGYPRQQKTKPQPHKTNQNSTTELNNTTQSDKTNAMEILLGEAQRIQKTRTTTTESKTDIILASLSVAESIVNYFAMTTHSSDDTPPSVDDGECPDHFVPTVLCRNDLTQDPVSNSITLHPRVYAMDCEMVLTSSGHELARVTIIQATPSDDDPEHYTVVLDELIKPRRPILDYKTVYSGITPTMLENVTMRIEQVQAAILSIICKEDILIGHSLENDLRAVRVFHENIIDTAVMFRSKNGRKHSLRHLSAVLLKKKIQTGCGTHGHCSEEDAAASLLLAERRCRLGKSFGLHDKVSAKNIFEFVCESRRDKVDPSRSYMVTRDRSSPLVCLGQPTWIQNHVTNHKNTAHALTCDSISSPNVKAISAWLKSDKRKACLLWANLVIPTEDGADSVSKMDELIKQVVEQSGSGTEILLVFQKNAQRCMDIWEHRKACSDPRSSLSWTPSQEEEWLKSLEECRSGEAYWVGKS